MRVLITGATGLVGQEIVRLCHKKEILVNYLTTSKSKIKSSPNYQGFYWNPKKEKINPNVLKGSMPLYIWQEPRCLNAGPPRTKKQF